MSEESRPGYYKDHHGEWHRERRQGGDRRHRAAGNREAERRHGGRRQTDLQILEREHREMIREALNEFADGETSED